MFAMTMYSWPLVFTASNIFANAFLGPTIESTIESITATKARKACNQGNFGNLGIHGVHDIHNIHGRWTSSHSVLLLVPAQANQLVAASDSAYGIRRFSDDENDENDEDHDYRKKAYHGGESHRYSDNSPSHASQSSTIPASKFSSPFRIFSSLAASASSPPSKSSTYAEVFYEQDLESSGIHLEVGADVQYFPIVGFVFVTDAPGHCRPLPTIANASCTLHYHSEYHKEYPFGWFTPPDPQSRQCNDGSSIF